MPRRHKYKTRSWAERSYNKLCVMGRPVTIASSDSLLRVLKYIPDGLTERTKLPSNIDIFFEDNKYKIAATYLANLADWPNRHTELQDETINAFMMAAWDYMQKGEKIPAALTYMQAADASMRRTQFLNGDNKSNALVASEMSMEAGAIYNSIGELGQEFICRNNAYDQLCMAIEAYRILGRYDEANELYWRLYGMRESNSALYEKMQGAVDYEAHRVEQGQVGFSADKKIGTDMVGECIVLMLHDPVTKKTALAHIDAETSFKSLDIILANMPQNQLQCRIMGARYENSQSFNNIKLMADYLRDKNVNIISAQLQEFNGVSAVVVDPHDFSISEAVPGIKTENEILAKGIHFFQGCSKDLNMCFDYTKSDEHAPLKFTFPEAPMLQLHELAGIHDMVELNKHLYNCNVTEKSVVTNPILAVSAKGNEIISERLRLLEAAAVAIYPYAYVSFEVTQAARDVICKLPFYIGSNSAEANRPVNDFISNNLLSHNYLAAYIDPANIEQLRSLADDPTKYRDQVRAPHQTAVGL